MKRLSVILLVLALIIPSTLLFSSCSTNDTIDAEKLRGTYTQEFAGTTLNVYNWAEYISDGSESSLDTIAAFEKLTGITVNYSMFDSNEVMYSKLTSESVAYDVIIPSDYMIQRLKGENKLKAIDYSKITNYDLIDSKYKNLYFDPNNEYSVPYSVGLVGVIYNTTKLSNPDSWNVMWDEQYKGYILNFNNARDAFATAQFALNIDINTLDRAEWDAAAQKLKEQKSVYQGYVMDEVFNKMESENAYIAPYYAGDFLTMYGENPNLDIFYPKEGTNIFVDSMCIPYSCKNYEAALMFINFMLEPEVAIANAEFICYASPNTAVVNDEGYAQSMSEMHEDWKRILYDVLEDESVHKVYFKDISPEIRTYYETLWQDVKAYTP